MAGDGGGVKQEYERGHANFNSIAKLAFWPEMKRQELSNDALIDGSQHQVTFGSAHLGKTGRAVEASAIFPQRLHSGSCSLCFSKRF